MRLCIALFLTLLCYAGLTQDLEHNFGTTRSLLKIEGQVFSDTAWTKPIQGAIIIVKVLRNSKEKYINKPDGSGKMINPEFIPVYDRLTDDLGNDQVRTRNSGSYAFHIDLQKQYQITIAKPSFVTKEVEVVTLLDNEAKAILDRKSKGEIPSYRSNVTLMPYTEGKIGPPDSNLISKIMFSKDSNRMGFTAKEEYQMAESGEVNYRLAKKNQNSAGQNALDASSKSSDEDEKRVLVEDVINKSFGLAIDDDTINIVDSNLNQQGGWVYFGSDIKNENYGDDDRVFEGAYRNGKKQQTWTKLHPNKKKAIDLEFNENKFNGQFKTYYESGALESKGVYDQNLESKVFDFDLFYENGPVKADFQYDQLGRKNGQQYVYYPDGDLAVMAMFKNDTLHGKMLVLDRSGNILEERTYEQGELVETDRKSQKGIDNELDSLIQLVTRDSHNIESKVERALNELDSIEEQYESILAERAKELNELRSQLSTAELSMLKSKKESERMKALANLKEEKLKRNQLMLFGLGLVTLVILGLAFMLYKRNEERKRTNQLLTIQKTQIEEKNREITDSINYAKRIQDAILPPMNYVKKHLPDSFILYKPKDIIAGDFYWMEKSGDTAIFAAADCTGHGVPGAMVSVVCSNALTRCVREFGMRQPAQILDKTRELVVETFELMTIPK